MLLIINIIISIIIKDIIIIKDLTIQENLIGVDIIII